MLWDIVIDVFSTEDEKKTLRVRNAGRVVTGSGALADECRTAVGADGNVSIPRVPSPEATLCPNDVLIFTLDNSDYVPPSMPKLLGLARLIIGEDNDAVLKILIKGRNPTFRHVPRTQRVDTDFVHEIIKDN